MKKSGSLILFIIIIIMISISVLISQNKGFALVEEDKSFWNDILNDPIIENKNMLYASYVAYKENLNDLSMETLLECINSSPRNDVLVSISNYYIGKNLFMMGNFKDAAIRFEKVGKSRMIKYDDIRFSAMINAAITYYQLKDIQKFRENLQTVIAEDTGGKYKRIALDILAQE